MKFRLKEESRIAIPVTGNRGLLSIVSRHFGKAEGFIIVDTAATEIVYLETSAARVENECAPIHALNSKGCQALVCFSMGGGAHRRCMENDLKVFRLEDAERVCDALEQYNSGCLEIFGKEALCSHQHH